MNESWWPPPILSKGVGEPHEGFQDGDGGAGEPAGAEGAEPEAGAGGLWGNDRPVQRPGEEGEGEGERGRRAGDQVSEGGAYRCIAIR